MKIAERADEDPWRRALRTAIIYDRKRDVLALAGTDPSALPADSARLLGAPGPIRPGLDRSI